MTDALENGDLWWLCPDDKHATIEHARKSKRRSLMLCDLSHRSVFGSAQWSRLTTPRTTGRGRNGGIGPDHSPRAYLRACHGLNRRSASGDATPSTDCSDSAEDSEGSTSAGPRLSGRRARCDAAESANVMRHRICLARRRDHARRTKSAFVLRARKRYLVV